jgi:uncharacterized protein (DUF433 family)
MESKIISVNPEILSGMAVFQGTRVPIKNLFDYIETGNTLEKFLEEFPSVKKEQVISLMELAENILISNARIYEDIDRRMPS